MKYIRVTLPGDFVPEIVWAEEVPEGYRIDNPTINSKINYGDIVSVSGLSVSEDGGLVYNFDKLIYESGFHSLLLLFERDEMEEEIENLTDKLQDLGFTVYCQKERKLYSIVTHILIHPDILNEHMKKNGFVFEEGIFSKKEIYESSRNTLY